MRSPPKQRRGRPAAHLPCPVWVGCAGGSLANQGGNLKQQADGAQPLSCIIFRPHLTPSAQVQLWEDVAAILVRFVREAFPPFQMLKPKAGRLYILFFFTWTTNKGSANSRARATTKTSGRFPTSISFLFNHPRTDRPLTSFGVCAHNRGSEPALLISARLPGGL